MSAKQRIKNIYNELNENQRRVADYFLKIDIEELNSSIETVAQKVGTSVASISRFCRRLDYKNFQQFKIALSQDLKYKSDEVLPIFQESDDEDLTIRRAFARGITNLQDTEKTVDFTLLKKTAELISSSGMLYFFGLGGSGSIGKLAALLFSHTGFRAEVVTDPYEMLVRAGHMKKEDLLIAISHTGNTKAVIEAAVFAHGRKIKVIAITNYLNSHLTETADIVLLTACYEGNIHFAQSNSMIAQLAIIDALYVLSASRSPRCIVGRVNEIEHQMKSRLRYNEK
jgi:RpiR family transcriptional regulator, carbohydrate utilization regulator